MAFEYNYLGTSLNYQFNTYKVIEQDEQALAANPNPFAIIVPTVLLALKKTKMPEEELYIKKLDLAKNLMKRKIPVQKIRAIMIFLNLSCHGSCLHEPFPASGSWGETMAAGETSFSFFS